MQAITKQQFVCEICGTEYDTEQEAITCEEKGKKLETLKDTQCWQWVQCKDAPDPLGFYYFIIGRRKSSDNDKLSCAYRTINFVCSDNTILPMTHDTIILETLSLEEGYERFGKLPPFTETRMRNYPIPKEVLSRMKTLCAHDNVRLQSIIKSLPREVLADYVYTINEKIFDKRFITIDRSSISLERYLDKKQK